MTDELIDLLETAMYMEVASEAIYEEGQHQTSDPGAKTLMKELAAEEKRHVRLLREWKEKGIHDEDWHAEKLLDLKISDYLISPAKLQEAGLQETLTFAIRREQQAVEFYSKMMSALRTRAAKEFCERLVHEELRHKQKLELLYDDLFYAED